MNSYLLILPGFFLVILIIMAQVYWLELRQFQEKALKNSYKTKERFEFADNFNRAHWMFRGALLGSLLCVVCITLPLYLNEQIVSTILKLIMGSIAFALVILKIVYISGNFIIRIHSRGKLYELIESDREKEKSEFKQ